MAHPIINPPTGQRSWVICNHPTTVAVSRLHLVDRHVPRVPPDNFDAIVTRVWTALPHPDTGLRT